MKKIVSLILTFIIAFSISACGSKSNESKSNASQLSDGEISSIVEEKLSYELERKDLKEEGGECRYDITSIDRGVGGITVNGTIELYDKYGKKMYANSALYKKFLMFISNDPEFDDYFYIF